MTSNQIFAMAPVILSMVVPISIFLMLFFFLKARHAERMAMIEKGMEFKRRSRRPAGTFWVKAGMLLFGVGLGATAGIFMEYAFNIQNEGIYPALMLLFGGGSLVLYYVLSHNIANMDKENGE